MVDFYHAAGDAEAAATAVTGETRQANGTVAGFPEASRYGITCIRQLHRDDSAAAPVSTVWCTVSIGALEDKVLSGISKQYIPLTREQRLATTLTGIAMHVRDARVKNESRHGSGCVTGPGIAKSCKSTRLSGIHGSSGRSA